MRLYFSLTILLLIANVPWRGARASQDAPSDQGRKLSIQETLQTIRIPSIYYRKAELYDICQDLTWRINEASTNFSKIKVSFRNVARPTAKDPTKITLCVEDVTMVDLIQQIAKLGSLGCEFSTDTVWFVSSSSGDKQPPPPPDPLYLQKILQTIQVRASDYTNASLIDVCQDLATRICEASTNLSNVRVGFYVIEKPTAKDPTRITLSAKDVSVLDLIQQVAKTGSLECKFSTNVVGFVSSSSGDAVRQMIQEESIRDSSSPAPRVYSGRLEELFTPKVDVSYAQFDSEKNMFFLNRAQRLAVTLTLAPEFLVNRPTPVCVRTADFIYILPKFPTVRFPEPGGPAIEVSLVTADGGGKSVLSDDWYVEKSRHNTIRFGDYPRVVAVHRSFFPRLLPVGTYKLIVKCHLEAEQHKQSLPFVEAVTSTIQVVDTLLPERGELLRQWLSYPGSYPLSKEQFHIIANEKDVTQYPKVVECIALWAMEFGEDDLAYDSALRYLRSPDSRGDFYRQMSIRFNQLCRKMNKKNPIVIRPCVATNSSVVAHPPEDTGVPD